MFFSNDPSVKRRVLKQKSDFRLSTRIAVKSSGLLSFRCVVTKWQTLRCFKLTYLLWRCLEFCFGDMFPTIFVQPTHEWQNPFARLLSNAATRQPDSIDVNSQDVESWYIKRRRENLEFLTTCRWWFQIFCMFAPKLGKDSHFDSYFSIGLVQPPTRKSISSIFKCLCWFILLNCLSDVLVS